MPPSNSSVANPHDGEYIGIPTVKNSTKNELDAQKLEDMHEALPDSTHAERQRFLMDRKGDTKAAIAKLRNYLEWREQYRDDDLNHLDPWSYATLMAIRSTKGGDNNIDGTVKLPCPVFVQEHTQTSTSDHGDAAIIKKRYFQYIPARMDTKLADISTYALALAIYIDRELDRNSTEKITVVIDVRAGHGWANPTVFQLLPFIQTTARLLCDLFPLRLDSCVIFPVPQMASAIWKAVQPFVGTDTRKKVCLVTGSAWKNTRVPKQLSTYLDEGLITDFEERRRVFLS